MKVKTQFQLLVFFLFVNLAFLNGQCIIADAGITYQCQENNPWDPNDDTFTFTLNPWGTGLGDSYSVEGIVNGFDLPYGNPSGPFGPFTLDASGGGFTIYLYDDTQNCNGLDVFVSPSELCFNYIQGPQEVCVGECATYIPSSVDQDPFAFYLWQMSNGTTSTETFFTACFDQPGTYFIYLTTFDSLQNEEMDSLFVYVEDFWVPEIESNSAAVCPNNGNSTACDQVCANSQVVYSVPFGVGTAFQWEVTGAESYTIDGDKLIVEWGSPGTGQVSVYALGGFCEGFNSLCVNILETPEAVIKSTPPIVNGVVEICEGQTLYLLNESEGGLTYLWDFGNGNSSTEVNPSTVYSNAGTYELSLIAFNECLCSDTTTITVEVEDAISPEIQCVGTICENETVTYSTAADCGTFYWSISSNGTITDGGGTSDNTITVDWGLGPVGTIELLVDACNGDYCIAPAIEQIGIISDDAEIEGPEIVCRGELATYTITQYDGTDYFWEVSNFGAIQSGQGSNTIVVKWNSNNLPNASQWVNVTYANCYLECGGDDTHTVNIRPGFFAEGPIEVCANSTTTYQSKTDEGGNNFVSSNWTVTAMDGSVAWSSSAAASQVNVDWTVAPGAYLLTVLPDDPTAVCEDQYTVNITVIENPPMVNSIEGEDLICPGAYYTYEALSSQPENSFEWTFTDGTATTTVLGNPVNYAWGSTGPYIASVVQISTTGLPCVSDPIDLAVNAIGDFDLTGMDELCQEEVGQYSATLYDNIEYDWSISPDDAGTIIMGDNSAVINILWHKSGPATVEASLCGLSKQFAVTVHALPEPTVSHPAALCPGETAAVNTNLAYDAYVWKNEAGNTISTLANPTLMGGYYQVEVTDANGCKEDTTFYIETLPLPVISISTPFSEGYCATVDSMTIYAVDTDAGYDYQWYKDNVAVGTNIPSLEVTDFGYYRVVVTDENGCTNSSNTINIFEYCGPGGGVCNGGSCDLPQDCPGDGLIQFEINSTSACNVSNFVNTSTSFIPGTLHWNFDDPASGADNYSTLENPSHTYANAGFFKVLFYGKVPTATGEATCWEINIDTVLAVADFDAELACAASVIEFEDLSTFIPGLTNITSWSWDFGDPASGIDNTSTMQHPSHIFAVDGTYTVSLTITDATGCSSTKSREVTVHPLPTVSFPQPTINCEGTALQFDLVGSPNITYVEWDFGDPASGAANRSEQESTFHIFETPGNYTVTLTAENIYGCRDSYTDIIVVEPNGLTGDISFSNASPICEGDSTTLTAPTGGIQWIWSTGAVGESITVSEANVYNVTVTNSEGCTYVPPTAIVDVIAAPTTTIKAVQYNEYGQAVGYFYDNYTICEGEDVYLQVEENAQYSFSWSDGTVNETEIVFADWRGNQLTAGTYDFSVTVTDNTTGCSSIEGPFQVEVNPIPANVTISSSVALPVCANTPAVLSVDSPDANYNYIWSNGFVGTSLNILEPGEYYVNAINQFGCEAESNRITIHPGPDISKIPGGCHTKCSPDTICLPNLPNIVSFQWFLDGIAIPAPEGTVPDLIATQSGDYHVEMIDNIGCTSTSDILTLELLDGYGTFEGNVYFDVNNNGIIDGPDTLMSGVNIQLTDNTGILDNTNTNSAGFYDFQDILSQPYTLVLDTNSISSYFGVNPIGIDTQLVGCDDLEQVDWLVFLDCPNLLDTIYFETCPNDSVPYNGTYLYPGTETLFTFPTSYSCDSNILVIVEDLGTSIPTSLNLQACVGSAIQYEGVNLFPGDAMDFTLKNQFNCDSLVSVTVDAIVVDTTDITLNACSGTAVVYQGEEIETGDEKLLKYTNYLGCDSFVNVSVEAFPEANFDLNSNLTCWNENLGELKIENISGGAGPYEYSMDGVNYQTDPIFENLKGGQQVVFVKDANNCIVEKETMIDEIAPLAISHNDRIFPCDADSVKLEVIAVSTNSSLTNYIWNNGSLDASSYVDAPGRHWVEITNECETVQYDIDLPLAKDEHTDFLYMPNAFSPDGDGQNDYYEAMPAGDVVVLAFDMQIFDRWGNLVFMSNDINNSWDGMYNGTKLSAGVFIWKMKATINSCNRQIDLSKNGDLTLLR